MTSDPITSRETKPRQREEPPRDEQKAPAPKLHQPQRSTAVWGPVIGVMIAGAIILAFGVWIHVRAAHEREQFAQQTSEVVVNVQTVHHNSKPIDLVLPGTIDANQSTTLYARTNGYLGKWNVDIGDNVKTGQVLANIETPDVEQQLRQAEGTLNQAKSNFEIARVTAVRWQDLYEKKVVAAQDNDTQQSNYQAAAAAQSAAQANVNYLQQELSFNQIVAPFPGKITYRYHDTGQLVAEGSGSAGTPIYDLQQTDPLLIYVYVPQENAPDIHVGISAALLVREYPGRKFVAKVTRTAGAIDQNSRTLLTELQIPNPDGTLYAGMYGELQFTLKETTNPPIILPANAYIFRTAGAQVLVLRNGKIHWQTIKVGRDFGTTMEVLQGLNEGDKVVMSPTDDLQEGEQVTPREQPASGG